MSWTDQALTVRTASESFLVDTCTIRTFNGYSTVDGEYTESFTDVNNVPCRLINRQGSVQQQPDSQERALQLLISTNTLKIQLPYAVSVTEKDKIIYNNTTYDVVYVPVKHSLMGAFVVQIEKRK
jgi:hypothetical protein